MFDWIRSHDALLSTLAVASAVVFVGSLLLVPILVAKIPADYFATPARHRTHFETAHPALRLIGIAIKNLLGALLLVAGFAMLVLPGQGLLTMLLGLFLLDFPGKYRFERWLIRRPIVYRPIAWLRRRRGVPPLESGDDP